MNKNKVIKISIITVASILVIAIAIGLFMFNMPHRDVQQSKTDFSVSATQLVDEYLTNKDAANSKYLSEDGESKILEVTGVVNEISEDLKGQKVILLKEKNESAGVRASFTEETSPNADNISIGQNITIKGVIRSGAAYDEDLELFENVILEKSDIVKN